MGYHLKFRSNKAQPLVKESLIPTKEISFTPLDFVLTERRALAELKPPTKETDPEQKTDPWAIIGLVLGLIPTVSLLGVIIGFFSLNRIKKNPKLKGQKLAKGGIIAGSIYTLIILAILLSTYRE